MIDSYVAPWIMAARMCAHVLKLKVLRDLPVAWVPARLAVLVVLLPGNTLPTRSSRPSRGRARLPPSPPSRSQLREDSGGRCRLHITRGWSGDASSGRRKKCTFTALPSAARPTRKRLGDLLRASGGRLASGPAAASASAAAGVGATAAEMAIATPEPGEGPWL